MDAAAADSLRGVGAAADRVDESTPPRARFSIRTFGAAVRNPRSPIRHPLVLLGLITLLGAILRLVSLDRPALWGDEAFTYSRICGSFRQMLDVLQFNGFMPLSYIVTWTVGQYWDLSPHAMRLPVAIPGMLLPPAIYMLARQLRIPVGTSLVVALFAACSAYMLTYARDAKMYAPFWTFATLHVSCLLWWLRWTPEAGGSAPRHFQRPVWRVIGTVGDFLWSLATSPATFRFLCWVTAGVVMMGYNALGQLVLGIEAIIFLTWYRPDWRKVLPFVLGLGVVFVVKHLHFEYFTDWDNQVTDDGNWMASGLFWIDGYNAERSGGDLLTFAATAFLMSWEWPQRSWQPMVDPRVLKTLMAVSVTFLVLAGLGMLPWRSRLLARRDVAAGPNPSAPGLLPASDRPGPKDWWRPAFWLITWMAVPAYAVYCLSIPINREPYTAKTGTVFVSPRYWVDPIVALGPAAVDEIVAMPWVSAAGIGRTSVAVALWTIAGALVAAGAWLIWRRSRRFDIPAGVLILLINLGVLLAVTYAVLEWKAIADAAKNKHWHSIWMPRYLGVVWPAFAIALVVLLMRLPTRPLRAAAISLLIGVNLTQFAVRTWGGSEPRTDLMARDIADSQPLSVRHNQLALDALRNAQWQAMGLPSRPELITRQLAKLPLAAPDTRVYLNTGIWNPGPGGGVLGSFAMRMYLCELVGVRTTPQEMRRRGGALERRWTYTSSLSHRVINADIRNHPATRRLITWERLDPGKRDINRADPLLKTLGDQWRRVSEDSYTARDHWTWKHMYELRRREYVRDGGPSTRPAVPPGATQPSPAPGKPTTRP